MACSMARSDGFKILSRHRKAADGLQLKATSEAEKVLGGKEAPLWICSLLPADVGASLQHVVIVNSESRRPKSIFTWASGNESGFTLPPFFLLPTPFLPFSPCIVSSHTHTLWSSAPGMPSHTFPLKLIWLKTSPVRGSYSFSLCSNTMFSCFSWLETVKNTLSETCQGSNVSNGFKTFFDLQVLTELYYLQSVVCGRAKHGGRAPPRLASVS